MRNKAVEGFLWVPQAAKSNNIHLCLVTPSRVVDHEFVVASFCLLVAKMG